MGRGRKDIWRSIAVDYKLDTLSCYIVKENFPKEGIPFSSFECCPVHVLVHTAMLCVHNMRVKELKLARFLETWCEKILFFAASLKTSMEVSMQKQILRCCFIAFIGRLDSAIMQAQRSPGHVSLGSFREQS